jgi:hypothetical protein
MYVLTRTDRDADEEAEEKRLMQEVQDMYNDEKSKQQRRRLTSATNSEGDTLSRANKEGDGDDDIKMGVMDDAFDLNNTRASHAHDLMGFAHHGFNFDQPGTTALGEYTFAADQSRNNYNHNNNHMFGQLQLPPPAMGAGDLEIHPYNAYMPPQGTIDISSLASWSKLAAEPSPSPLVRGMMPQRRPGYPMPMPMPTDHNKLLSGHEQHYPLAPSDGPVQPLTEDNLKQHMARMARLAPAMHGRKKSSKGSSGITGGSGTREVDMHDFASADGMRQQQQQQQQHQHQHAYAGPYNPHMPHMPHMYRDHPQLPYGGPSPMEGYGYPYGAYPQIHAMAGDDMAADSRVSATLVTQNPHGGQSVQVFPRSGPNFGVRSPQLRANMNMAMQRQLDLFPPDGNGFRGPGPRPGYADDQVQNRGFFPGYGDATGQENPGYRVPGREDRGPADSSAHRPPSSMLPGNKTPLSGNKTPLKSALKKTSRVALEAQIQGPDAPDAPILGPPRTVKQQVYFHPPSVSCDHSWLVFIPVSSLFVPRL